MKVIKGMVDSIKILTCNMIIHKENITYVGFNTIYNQYIVGMKGGNELILNQGNMDDSAIQIINTWR